MAGRQRERQRGGVRREREGVGVREVGCGGRGVRGVGRRQRGGWGGRWDRSKVSFPTQDRRVSNLTAACAERVNVLKVVRVPFVAGAGRDRRILVRDGWRLFLGLCGHQRWNRAVLFSYRWWTLNPRLDPAPPESTCRAGAGAG